MANKVILNGTVGKQPDINETKKGTLVANFSLATNESQPDGNGGWKQVTEWHNCVSFGKKAEFVENWIGKGTKLYIEGKIRTNKYEDKNGITQYRTQILVDVIEPNSKLEKQEPEIVTAVPDIDIPESANTTDDTPQQQRAMSFNDDDIPF